MCPWVGPHAPSFGPQLWGLPSRVEYLSLQGVLLPLVYGTTASPLWLELRGRPAWQATPSWTVYRLACHRLLPWLQVTFAMVPDAAWPGSDQWPWSTAPATRPVGRLGCWFFPVPRPPYVCAVSWAPWLVFTGVPARCVALRLRCPGPLGSCSPVRPLAALICLCGVLGHLAPVHRCARVVCRVACAVSWATWLLFTGVPGQRVVLCVGCLGPLGSCSPVCPLGVLLCVCGVLGHLAPVHRCAWPWCPVPLLSSVLVCVQCPGPGGACSPACALCAVCACRWWLCLSSTPPSFFLFVPSLFLSRNFNKKL